MTNHSISSSTLIEGWRGINHSFAMVNQFQLLEWVKRGDCRLAHLDAPFHYPHWNRNANGAGFSLEDEAALSALPAPTPGERFDGVYRIASPIDLRPSTWSERLVVFVVTELGLDAGSLVAGSDIRDFVTRGGRIVTPSHWSRERLLDFGFPPDSVVVVPHAASPGYFHPISSELIQQQRQMLGVGSNETLLLNIGAAIWNKGIDVLLRGFAIARQKRKDLRLFFKDQRNTYGIAGDTYVQSTLAAAGLLNEDVLGAITLIPANLNMEQMTAIYNLADAYVSPYRAEGFNLPACEAMACGTPVVVTEGGATDDFVSGPGHHRIRSTRHEHVTIQGKDISAYCEPDLDHLVSILCELTPKSGAGLPSAGSGTPGWAAPVEQLVQLLR